MTTTAAPTVDVNELFAAVDRQDAEAFGSYLDPEATYTFSNFETVVGRDNIVLATAAFFGTITAVSHELTNVWQVDDGFIAQMVITTELPDGRTVVLPSAVISRVRDGLITDHQIYINETPLAG